MDKTGSRIYVRQVNDVTREEQMMSDMYMGFFFFFRTLWRNYEMFHRENNRQLMNDEFSLVIALEKCK